MTTSAKKYVVRLEPGVWIASWTGDPGRTTAQGNARAFTTIARAQTALAAARRHRTFLRAKILRKAP